MISNSRTYKIRSQVSELLFNTTRDRNAVAAIYRMVGGVWPAQPARHRLPATPSPE